MHKWTVLKNSFKIRIKIDIITAPTCFGTVTPSSGSALMRSLMMIIFSLIVFFNVKVSLFFVFFLTPLCLISGFWCLICSLLFFISFIYLFFFPFFWIIFLVVIWFLMVLFFLVCESVFLWFWPESLFFVWDTFLGFSFLLSLFLTILLYCTFTRIGLLSFYIFWE